MQTISQLSAYALSCVLAFSILLTASVVNHLLGRKYPQNETFKKVTIIVKSWWLIIGTLLVALSWQKWGMILLCYVLTVFIIIEYMKVSRTPHKKLIQSALLILTTFQYLALCFESFHFFQAMIPILCLWIVPGLVIFQAAVTEIVLIFAVTFGMSFTIYYLSHVPAITTLHAKLGLVPDQAIMAVVILVILTWGNDVFQFICGKAFGKRKIVPLISPNKTLGGFIGGMICTTVVSVLATPPLMGLSLKAALLLGPIIFISGVFGDLFFSTVKRNVGTKDFSDALPGHGGLLDRMDSLIFTAPIYFHFLAVMNGGVL